MYIKAWVLEFEPEHPITPWRSSYLACSTLTFLRPFRRNKTNLPAFQRPRFEAMAPAKEREGKPSQGTVRWEFKLRGHVAGRSADPPPPTILVRHDKLKFVHSRTPQRLYKTNVKPKDVQKTQNPSPANQEGLPESGSITERSKTNATMPTLSGTGHNG